MHILILGGVGGIGAGMITEARRRFPTAEIHATYHKHTSDNFDTSVIWHEVNICDEAEVETLANQFDELQLLINCVGLLHLDSQLPEKSINQFNPDFFNANIQINALPSLLLAKHFQTVLNRSTLSYFVTVSAKVGSISDNRLGGWMSYRCSKAALNMALKTLSIEWHRTAPNICVLSFHPGTTDTALSKPFQARLPQGQLQTPAQTAHYFFDLLSKLTTEDSGSFIDYAGNKLPW
ncbi:SDR family NAD(P)-dependent oxidoreductase [Shewanella sp. 202IG2-18]|uniref:SDR family NAD(P)-dependent oxidoreductase n=1 Tax=Parashewanella hymeniacidonis TaxID=2807618 RepID=UPI00195F91FB|nr:SDR family NAD(P)-dependent oxidoreductase [Parashewanella hymeniacidonis]MBM7071728.1 SDR family NAD(P)-dependent oxidoreductase [Parashewanella hymeniacidonis]